MSYEPDIEKIIREIRDGHDEKWYPTTVEELEKLDGIAEKLSISLDKVVKAFESLEDVLAKFGLILEAFKPVIDILEEQNKEKPKPKKFREVKYIRNRTYGYNMGPPRYNRTTYK